MGQGAGGLGGRDVGAIWLVTGVVGGVGGWAREASGGAERGGGPDSEQRRH